MSRDTGENRTEELVRRAVEAGIRRYGAARRERIGNFVDQHFSLRGSVALHRYALGWDLVRAPANLTMAAPAAASHLAAAGARRLGAVRLADALGRRRLLLRTSVARRVEWLVCTETCPNYPTGLAIASPPMMPLPRRSQLTRTYSAPCRRDWHLIESQPMVRRSTSASSVHWHSTPSPALRRQRSPPHC